MSFLIHLPKFCIKALCLIEMKCLLPFLNEFFENFIECILIISQSPNSSEVHPHSSTYQALCPHFLKKHWVQFIVLLMSSTRSGWTQEESTLKETPCFSPSSHQVPMAPYLGMGLHVPSSLPARIFSVLNLHKHWVPLCGCPAGCGRCCFLVVFSRLCLLKTFPPPPLQSYLGHRRGCGLAVPFSARSPTVSRSCTLTR